jgi:hypothetical protein
VSRVAQLGGSSRSGNGERRGGHQYEHELAERRAGRPPPGRRGRPGQAARSRRHGSQARWGPPPRSASRARNRPSSSGSANRGPERQDVPAGCRAPRPARSGFLDRAEAGFRGARPSRSAGPLVHGPDRSDLSASAVQGALGVATSRAISLVAPWPGLARRTSAASTSWAWSGDGGLVSAHRPSGMRGRARVNGQTGGAAAPPLRLRRRAYWRSCRPSHPAGAGQRVAVERLVGAPERTSARRSRWCGRPRAAGRAGCRCRWGPARGLVDGGPTDGEVGR